MAILTQNNHQRRSETWQRRQPEALLMGLLYAPNGEKFTPSFTCKPNGKRYRYYIPNRKISFGAEASQVSRVPAEPIEQMVLAQVHAALQAPEMIQAVWESAKKQCPTITEPEVVLPLRRMANVWSQLFPEERLRIVQLLIERVVLRDDGIEILWHASGWPTLVGEMCPGTMGAELLEQEEALA
jgi:hypothetical protein